MTTPAPIRIVIAGGGTGGHIIPALAIARVLKEAHGAEILFIGTSRGLETKVVPQAGFHLELVEIGALNQVSFATRLKTGITLPGATLAASRILKRFKADVVLGVGGYASGPAMAAAIMQGLPTMVFEPNLVPGFANRAASRFVNAAACHFEQTRMYLRNARVTGVPVRSEFVAMPDKPSGAVRTLLITGGSQGAHAINQAMMAAAPMLRDKLHDIAILHQTGKKDFEDVSLAYANAGVQAVVQEFITDMPAAFAQADIVICRSGASTCAELSASGRPSVLIPFPFAADDHQTRNALAMKEQGAAEVITQSELTPEKLLGTLSSLLESPQRLSAMGVAARKMSHPNAAADISQMLFELARKP